MLLYTNKRSPYSTLAKVDASYLQRVKELQEARHDTLVLHTILHVVDSEFCSRLPLSTSLTAPGTSSSTQYTARARHVANGYLPHEALEEVQKLCSQRFEGKLACTETLYRFQRSFARKLRCRRICHQRRHGKGRGHRHE